MDLSEDSLELLDGKNKRDPLPMKMRALPQSFWQQPNCLGKVPPTSYCLPLDNDAEQSSHSEVVGVPNTELLFSLFHSVEACEVEVPKTKHLSVLKRGRPRKKKNNLNYRSKKDVDPYFTSATIPCNQRQENDKIINEQQMFALLSATEDSNNLSANSSYLERLSNLVVNL